MQAYSVGGRRNGGNAPSLVSQESQRGLNFRNPPTLLPLLPACSSTPPSWHTSRGPKARGSVTSTLQRGVISILRVQQDVAEYFLCYIEAVFHFESIG